MIVASRRLVIGLPMLVLAGSAGHAQQASAFVGEWQGKVDGIGDARIVITAVKPSGQVEGRMEFALQSFVSTFADKWNSAERTNRGMVAGSVLTIESALGGVYTLTLAGNQLSGTYVRGTTLSGKAEFRKA